MEKNNMSLNPCCSGRGSSTYWFAVKDSNGKCLNPCCSGRGSSTFEDLLMGATVDVS